MAGQAPVASDSATVPAVVLPDSSLPVNPDVVEAIDASTIVSGETTPQQVVVTQPAEQPAVDSAITNAPATAPATQPAEPTEEEADADAQLLEILDAAEALADQQQAEEIENEVSEAINEAEE